MFVLVVSDNGLVQDVSCQSVLEDLQMTLHHVVVVVPVLLLMLVLVVWLAGLDLNVNMQFVSESLQIVLQFVQVEEEHVLHQMSVQLVKDNGLELNVKSQSVMDSQQTTHKLVLDVVLV